MNLKNNKVVKVSLTGGIIGALAILAISTNSLFAQKTKPVAAMPYKKYSFYGSDSIQTKNGLIIEVEPLSPSGVYAHPELYSFDKNTFPKEFLKKYDLNIEGMFAELDSKRYLYTFGSGENYLTVFKVKITNNTGHVLKMKEARILLRIEGEDPIKPVTNIGDATIEQFENPAGSGKFIPLPKSAITQDQSLVQWVTGIESKYEETRKHGFLELEYPIGINSQVIAQNKKSYKLIADADVEILPDDSYSGILLFPVLVSYEQLSLKMYEFVTKTDAAGTPTERTNFDYKFKIAAGKMWLNRNENKWVDGNPPSDVEYYDKKQKVWIFGAPEKK
jgi:hypothetical protein